MELDARQLNADALAANLDPNIALTLEHITVCEEVESTHKQLMLDESCSPSPKLLIAYAQTAGVGQRGRVWISQNPGHCLNFSLRRQIESKQIQDIANWPIEAAKRIVDVFKAYKLDQHLRIKPPNDLFWQSQKLAGILIETQPLICQTHHGVVVSLGMNLSLSDEDRARIDQPAADLSTLLSSTSPTPNFELNHFVAEITTTLLTLP